MCIRDRELREPVSEDPTLTVLVRLPLQDPGLTIFGRDNQGETYRSVIPASWRQSAITPAPDARAPAQ
jgi:sulfur-oxidizing protein SoxY